MACSIRALTVAVAGVVILVAGASAETRILPVDATVNEEFGFTVALSGDVLAVGSHWDNDGAGVWTGSVSLFRFDGVTWALEDEITPADVLWGDQFGF